MEPAADSQLTGAPLPVPAMRLRAESIPGEVDEALRQLVAAAGEDARQGETETLAWTGDEYRASNVPAMMSRLARDLERAGWTYEVAEAEGALKIFSLVRMLPARRAVLGFYTSSDEALVLAWTEILAAPSPEPSASVTPSPSIPTASVLRPTNAGAKVIDVDASATHVNVMGREAPELPAFPSVTPKPGMVCGYVRDLRGEPIEGATLGVRVTAVGGFYSGAQGETDARGYYEFPVPAGMAHFYNAGVAIDWGDGLAALSLHPVDGKLGTFASPQGAVENFVLQAYGVTSRENLSESPHLPATYYGGAIYISHWTRAANDSWAPANNLIEGSIVEITLIPEGDMMSGEPARSFVIRRPAAGVGFRINNIPVGSYRIRATLADGTPLQLQLNKPRHSPFGMFPTETTGEARLVFAPESAKASMVLPAYGPWSAVELTVELP